MFTLGSVVAISSLPQNIKNVIIDVLGKVSQRVLMKYEDDQMKNMPENMMIKKWFPQRDIISMNTMFNTKKKSSLLFYLFYSES